MSTVLSAFIGGGSYWQNLAVFWKILNLNWGIFRCLWFYISFKLECELFDIKIEERAPMKFVPLYEINRKFSPSCSLLNCYHGYWEYWERGVYFGKLVWGKLWPVNRILDNVFFCGVAFLWVAQIGDLICLRGGLMSESVWWQKTTIP